MKLFPQANKHLTGWKKHPRVASSCWTWDVYMQGTSFQSCLTICYPMDCSPPGSSAWRILQAILLQYPRPRDQTLVSHVSCKGRQLVYYLHHLENPDMVSLPKCPFKSVSLRTRTVSYHLCILRGFPDGASGKEVAWQYMRRKRYWFDPWVGKIPWRRARWHTSGFLPGKSHGRGTWRATVHGVAKSRTWLKQLSMHACTCILKT